MGDSVTYGMSASAESKRWVNRTVTMLEEEQGSPIELINRGICGNILSPTSPAAGYAGGECGLLRLDADLIAWEPDMVFLAYGLNDSRGGTPLPVFAEDYQRMIDRIRKTLSPVIVALDLYYMHEEFYKGCEGWNCSDYALSEEYNQAIRQLAKKNGLIFADVYSAQAGVDWAVCEDHCHPNDLGHRLIANKVFEAIMQNCSL